MNASLRALNVLCRLLGLLAISTFAIACGCGSDDGAKTSGDDPDGGVDSGAASGGQAGSGSGGRSGGGSGGAAGSAGTASGGQAGSGGAPMAGITVSEISGDTSEDGDQATFTVVLDAEPSADVTVNFDSDDTSEGTVTVKSLTFTSDNWDAPQSVTVTGVDDDEADGNQDYGIAFSATTSDDDDYDGLVPETVQVTNIDDETAGIRVSEISGDTTEAGGEATFTVVLNSAPSEDVTVHFDSDDATEGEVSTTSLTFTPDNWDAPQTVTVTGVDDDEADGNQDYSIEFSETTSNDADYDGIVPDAVSVTNVDDETAGITVGEISGDTSEAGGQATFTVVLNSQPAADVTVNFDSDDTSEGTVSATSLTFTPANWDAPQTVTVTGQDDNVADGNQTYAIVFSASESDDDDYDGLVPSSVDVTNVDNETAGFTVSEISGNTTEAGGQATFTIVLNSRPSASVTLELGSTDVTEGVTDVDELTFTPDNWNAPQTVTVTGQDDDVADGDQTYAVFFDGATSDDDDYAGLDPNNVEVINVDDETAGFTVSPISGNTTEAGGQATFTIVLNSQPTADVVLTFDSDDTSEGTVSPTTLTFTSVNWNAPRTVTVTGQDDDVADGNQTYSIRFDEASSSDSGYDGLTPPSVSVTNTDDETAGITVSAISGNTTETGGQATFTVVLNTPPLEDVTVNFASNDPGEGTTGVTSLTFNADNWNSVRTVTVTGQDDDIADGNQPYQIVFSATTSDDPAYAAITPSAVNVINEDRGDSPGISVTVIDAITGEGGGTGQFSVVLLSEPTAAVVINFNTSRPDEGRPGRTSLTFTPANWDAPQTVTVTGQNDDLADGDQPYAIVFGPTTSADDSYDGRQPANIAMTNVDNDSAGVTVGPISGNTTEGGGQATFTVVLNSQPFDDVTFSFDTSDPTEGILDKTTLVFTAQNWNAPQTVTITGQNDAVADGNQTYFVVFDPTESDDDAYDNFAPANLAVINVDNDTAGITVSPISRNTTEAGGTAQFSVVLTSRPFDDVTVFFNTNDVTEGVPNVTQLTFTDQNWNAPRFVTVTGQNDDVADGNQQYAIVFTPSSSTGDAAYNGLTPNNVSVTNVDDDSAGIIVEVLDAETTEGGGTATFTVVLTSEPVATVTVNFHTDDPTEGTPDVTSLVFNGGNWDVEQTVTVTGLDDDLADGAQPYQIVFDDTTSGDEDYAAITPDAVELTNIDNDSAGINVTVIDSVTSESGDTASFTVVLNSEPFADVTVNFDTSDATEGIPGATSLLFTPGNWDIPQTVVIGGEDDAVDDGNQVYQIVFSSTTSSDAAYAAITPPQIQLTNVDNDTAGFNIFVQGDNETSESGGMATLVAALNSQPSANVVLRFRVSDGTEAFLNISQLTFTPDNWNQSHQVLVTGICDGVDDGDQAFEVEFTSITSSDPVYQAVSLPADVGFINVHVDACEE